MLGFLLLWGGFLVLGFFGFFFLFFKQRTDIPWSTLPLQFSKYIKNTYDFELLNHAFPVLLSSVPLMLNNRLFLESPRYEISDQILICKAEQLYELGDMTCELD